jgi:hypothetical protein
MADLPTVKTKRITRDKLAQFLPSHELIKAFENLSEDVAETLPDAISGAAVDAGSVIASMSFTRPIATPPAPDGDAGQVIAGAAFARQVQQPAAPDDTASQILATQIFGA